MDGLRLRLREPRYVHYDAIGRKTAQSDPFGLTIGYVYDDVLNKVTRSDSLGGLTTSTYDDAGRLASRSMSSNGTNWIKADLEYGPSGLLSTLTYSQTTRPTVARVKYDYQPSGRVETIETKVPAPGQTNPTRKVETLAYGYDSAGRLSFEDRSAWYTATDGSGQGSTYYLSKNPALSYRTTFTYDATDQLTAEQTGANTVARDYDATGNPSGGTNRVEPGNRLVEDAAWLYAHDDEGNLVRKVAKQGAEVWDYAYDHLNRLISASKSASIGGAMIAGVTYRYDALGDRIERAVSGTSPSVTRFAYDGDDLWADVSTANAPIARYLRGDAVDQVFAREDAQQVARWYLTDRLGSIVDLLKPDGSADSRLRYDGFGAVTASYGSTTDRYRYTGREFDAVTNQQYHRRRYYDVTSRRWTSEDPIGFEAGDVNYYRYVHNGPTNATDPSGLFEGPPHRSNWPLWRSQILEKGYPEEDLETWEAIANREGWDEEFLANTVAREMGLELFVPTPRPPEPTPDPTKEAIRIAAGTTQAVSTGVATGYAAVFAASQVAAGAAYAYAAAQAGSISGFLGGALYAGLGADNLGALGRGDDSYTHKGLTNLTGNSVVATFGEIGLNALGPGGISKILQGGGRLTKNVAVEVLTSVPEEYTKTYGKGSAVAFSGGHVVPAAKGFAKGVVEGGKNTLKKMADTPTAVVAPNSNSPYALFNKTHAGSQPVPKGLGPNGGRLQSHHGLQQEWAANSLPGYDPKLAPTVTIETGKGFPHTTLSKLQNARRDARVAAGLVKWSSSIDDELGFIVSDFRQAGFGDDLVKQVLEQNYRMLDKLGIKYTKPAGF